MPNYPKKSIPSSSVKKLPKEGSKKFVGPRNLKSFQAEEEVGISKSMARNENEGGDPRSDHQISRAESRRFNRMFTSRQQSSEDSYQNLVRLINKIPGSAKEKLALLSKVIRARKAPGGAPSFKDSYAG